MRTRSDHFNQLPLDELLLRLELAGFTISPADRLRIWQVLAGPGKRVLKDPRKLKYMLAPIIARGEAGQLRFYGIFDTYMDEVFADTGEQEAPAREIEWWHWLLGIVTLVLLGWAIGLVSQPLPPAPVANFTGPTYGSIGDTIRLQNQSTLGGDTSDFKVYWEWHDAVTNQLERIDSSQYHWTFVVPATLDSFYTKKIVLRLLPREGVRYREGNSLIAEQDFLVLCPFAPDVSNILGLPANPNDKVDTLERLYLRPQGATGPWIYAWDFGDGTRALGRDQYHQYQRPGKYSIKLSVRDTSAAGYCAIELNREVNVGRVQAYASVLPLRRDRQKPEATFSWGYWTLLSLLGIATLYYWARWVSRQPPPKPLTPEGSMAARFKVNDKAPYFIPFRSPAALLPLAPQQYRLAEAMRHRQAGFRRGIDVPKTLQATIERAGYPSVRFAYNTRPSEYLILVDEQSDLSHLGKLFAHVATSLRGQDVNADIYYYRRHFNRFWNKYVPDGLSAELLRRRYPGHRLLVLGDAHDLLDPHATGRPSLRKEYTTVLRQWPDRLLLTPIPPVSWSYREKQLAHFAAIYPADLAGLAQAAKYLEMDADPPSEDFKVWHLKQVEQRLDTDTEYRNWKRLRDHEAYLEDYPGLWNWFLALAVFPTPTWEITIAIGNALSKGTDLLSHDNLLRLARIPSLQVGRWSSRLRREMLAALDPATEKIARAAVRAELASVQAETRKGHAGIQLETELAIQDFALQPEDNQHQDTLRYLLKNNMLSPAQVAELDQIVPPTSSSGSQESETGIRSYLGETTDAPDPEKKQPWKVHPLFWKALAATFAFLFVFVIFWQLSGTDYLYKLAYGKTQASMGSRSDESLHRGIFVKESLQLDSSIVYNNYGVDLTRTTNDYRITAPFRRALALRNNNYPLAEANLLKSNYNTAVKLYNDYLNDNTFPYQLDSIHAYLRRAVSEYTLIPGGVLISDDSTGRDVQHLEGMLAYYEGNRALAENYQEALATTNYFDTLQAFPNLTTLLGLSHSKILSVEANEDSENNTIVDVNTFIEGNADDQLSVWIFLQSASDPPQSLPDTQRISLAGTGPANSQFTLKPSSTTGGTSDVLFAQIRDAAGRILDTQEQPLEKDWRAAPVRMPTYRFRGDIVDANSEKPIPNARIDVLERQPSKEMKPLGDPVYSDDKGEYDIRTKPTIRQRAIIQLRVSAKNYESREVDIMDGMDILQKGLPRTIELEPIVAGSSELEQKVAPQNVPPQKPETRQQDVTPPAEYPGGVPEFKTYFNGRVVDAQTGVPIPWAEALSPGQGLSRLAYPATQDGKIGFDLPASGLAQPMTYIFTADGYYPTRVSWEEMALKNKEEVRLQRGFNLAKLIQMSTDLSNYSLCVSCKIIDGEGDIFGSYDDCFYSEEETRRKTLQWQALTKNTDRRLLCRLMPLADQVKNFQASSRNVRYCVNEYFVNPTSGLSLVRDRGCFATLKEINDVLPNIELNKRTALENGYAIGFMLVAQPLEKSKK